MLRRTLSVFALLGAMAVGLLALDDLDARNLPGGVREQWVNANLVRVYVNGRWEDVPLMPLADHLCRGDNAMFRKYCHDAVFAPGEY